MSDSSENSYNQILKSSALIGGAQGINLLVGMVRTKFVAILIGPLGMGLVMTYQAIVQLISTVSGLGIGSSAVRDIAQAVNSADDEKVGRSILTLRRICVLTGLAGTAAVMVSAEALSQYTFDSGEHTRDIALLGLIVLFGSVQSGQAALIQGMRRIADLARLNVLSSLSGAIVSVALYAWLGLDGIVPALVSVALLQLLTTGYYARRVRAPVVEMSWMESFRAAGGMVRLGLAFMWSAVLVAVVAYLTRAFIAQEISLQAVGIFSAAYALSGMFINFILNAMGADYFPRLSAQSHDRQAMNRLVNEQAEIGLLLAVPGLLATLTLAPWIVRIFYTSEFLPATSLLQWFALGCLGRITSWPMGMMMMALGKGALSSAIQTGYNLLHLCLIWIGLRQFGVEGVAMAFCALYTISTVVNLLIFRHLTGFSWSRDMRALLGLLLPIVVLAFAGGRLLSLWPATAMGVLVTALASILCLRGLVQRIGQDHALVQQAYKVPGVRWACSL